MVHDPVVLVVILDRVVPDPVVQVVAGVRDLVLLGRDLPPVVALHDPVALLVREVVEPADFFRQ